MPYLTVSRMQGDPDELLEIKRERVDPVALRVGAEVPVEVPVEREHNEVERFELLR
jgi:hypothetical protein